MKSLIIIFTLALSVWLGAIALAYHIGFVNGSTETYLRLGNNILGGIK